MRTKKGFSIPTVLLGLVLLLLSEAARIFHVTGLPGLLVFFLPVIPLYLLLSKALDDGWERFLISSSLYIALMGLLLFIWRLNLFLPITFRALFLLVDFFIIAFSALLSFETAKIPLGFPSRIDYKKNLPILALLVFTTLFYSAAAEHQDSWHKELRNVKWAMTVSLASEGGQTGEILQFSNHAPFHAVLGAITANLFGFSQNSKALLHVVFAIFDVLMLVLLSQFMFKERTPGFFAALLLLSSGLFMHYTTTAFYAAPQIFFQLLTFYTMYRYTTTGNLSFRCLLPLFFSASFYAKPESVIFLVPICVFLLFKKTTNPKKEFVIKNLKIAPIAWFLVVTLLLTVPLILYMYDADAALNGVFGPLQYILHSKQPDRPLSMGPISIDLKDIINPGRFKSFFPGLGWSSPPSDRTRPIEEYVPLLFSNGGKNEAGQKISIMGEETVSGSFFETPQLYLLYLVVVFYFCFHNLRKQTVLITYVLYGFFVVFLFFWLVAWHQFASVLFIGFLAVGYCFSEAFSRFKRGSIRCAVVSGVFSFVLVSSFAFTANTVFNFDYTSGTNFYRYPLFQSYPVFGTFAIGKYVREHTTSAETYFIDPCYLSEAVVNRNAWTGAAPPSFGVVPAKDFYNYWFRETQSNQKEINYTKLIVNRAPAAEFFYKGFHYADLYPLYSKDRYLDAGVCVEASEYGRDYRNWGMTFSNPAGWC